MPGKNVLLISREDFAASGYKMVEAINLNTFHNVQYIRLIPSPMDTLGRLPSIFHFLDGEFKIHRNNLNDLNVLINRADILHFKGDYPPVPSYFPIIDIPADIPKIVTVGGMFFRRGDSVIAKPVREIKEYLNNTAYRSALTADLNYPEYQGHFTQHPIDISRYHYSWHESPNITIAHAPTSRAKKGTALFLDAIRILKKDNDIKINVDLIENVSHQECISRIAKASLFFDQCLFESYGNATVEALALGIPTITRISNEAIRQSEGKFNSSLPIIRCDNNVESIVAALRLALDSDLKDISIKSRQWCENFHSYEVVGKMWNNIYQTINSPGASHEA